MGHDAQNVFSKESAQDLRKTLAYTSDFDAFFDNLKRTNTASRLRDTLTYYSSLFDIELGRPQWQSKKLADRFHRGGLLGMFAARSYIITPNAQQIDAVLYSLEPPIDESASLRYQQLQYGEFINELGDKGFIQAHAYYAVFEEFGDRLCPEVLAKRQFRRGFGLIMQIINLADTVRVEPIGLEEAADSISRGEIDVDEEFIRELGQTG